MEKSRVLAVNRSTYYKWLNKKPDKTDENTEVQITSIYHKHKGTYGKESITQALRNEGILINHKKVYHIMRKWGLKAVIRKRWSIRKYIKENVACNVLNREFKTNDRALRESQQIKRCRFQTTNRRYQRNL